ncbi:MAG: M3 family metallopeptidase [Gammaproteobacteria bacterium]
MTDSALKQALAALPNFSKLKVESLVNDLKQLIEDNKQAIDTLFAERQTVGWDALIRPLENYSDALSRFFSPFSHLHNVADSPALREAYNEALPLLTEYANEYSQDRRIFEAYKALADLDATSDVLNLEQKQVTKNALRDFHLSGIDLEPDAQTRLREIRLRLSKLSTKFEEQVLDATQKWKKHIDDESLLSGMPKSAVDLCRQNAANENLDGYLLKLDYPCYMPVMTYADNRELREEVYEAYVTRASELGPHGRCFDNSETIDEILRLRKELSGLLGFSNYAEYSLATKMANTTSEVTKFLVDLAEKSRPAAKKELDELRLYAQQNLNLEELEAWDMSYAAEKLRQDKFAISQEELRPYFPIDRVFSGLFEIVRVLFGVQITEIHDVDTWHEDVRVFQVRDADDHLRGLFYTDLYAREFKRAGAWMDDCIGRREFDEYIQYPVAYLTCNFSPPVGLGEHKKPATLTHDEVLTLFHEFGHGLHHMLTLVGESAVAGINGVPWDGVELPSQFLENWCWETDALALISGHVDSGLPISAALIERMKSAKNFHAALQMLRQIEFALFDFRLHAEYQDGLDVQSLLDDVRATVAVARPPSYNRFQNSFSHIFAGGYAAGYYSYKWAELLSADAFSKFEEDGIFNPETGEAFRRCILERGGAVEMMDLFKAFRGREPDIKPLLRHSGLTSDTPPN